MLNLIIIIDFLIEDLHSLEILFLEKYLASFNMAFKISELKY